MAWRYINPGYVHLLDKAAQPNLAQITGNEYSKTGVSFYNTTSYSDGMAGNIALSNFAEGDDFWAKFDFYCPAAGINIRCCVPSAYRRSIQLYSSGGTSAYIYWLYNGTAVSIAYASSAQYFEQETGLKKSEINTVLFHVKYGVTGTCHLDIRINDKVFSVNPHRDWEYSSTELKKALLYTNSSLASFSNVIISNEEINFKEQVVTLPVSATETAMTLQSDTYIVNSVGQTLLQTVNVSSLISNYGSDSKVTGIALAGNPAYRTGEQLSSLTAISKSGGVITEHGTSYLTEDNTAAIWQGFSTASDTTIADLQNMQFGWKAGE